MLAGSFSLLLLIPVLVFVWGLFSLLKGTIQAQNQGFKMAFMSFLVGIVLSIFISLVMQSNNVDQANPEFLLFFHVSIAFLALSSIMGTVYTYFQPFIPPLFIRMTLIFSLISVVLGIITSLDTGSKSIAPGAKDSSLFKIVKPYTEPPATQQ